MKITEELIDEILKFDPSMPFSSRVPEFYLEEKSVLIRLLKDRDIEKIKEIIVLSDAIERRNNPSLIMGKFIESLYTLSLAINEPLDIDIKVGNFWAVVDGMELRMKTPLSDVIYKAVETDNKLVIYANEFGVKFPDLEYIFTIENGFIRDMYTPYSNEMYRYITDDRGNLLEKYTIRNNRRYERYIVYNQFGKVSKDISYSFDTEKDKKIERSEVNYKYDNDGKLLSIGDNIDFEYSNNKLRSIKSYDTFQIKFEYLNTTKFPITAIYGDDNRTKESLRYRTIIKER